MQACLDLDTAKERVESILSKLHQESEDASEYQETLTEQERRDLIAALEVHSTAIFKKRKLDQTNKDKAVVCNKKCQINRTADNKVSNFCQTDPVKLPPEIENILNSDEDDEEKLIRLLAHEDVPREQIELLMHRTFEKRRNFITIKSPLVAAVREQYPALFCVEEVKNELERIFYPGKCKEFLENMNIYTKHILHYKGSKIDDILEMIEKAHSQSRTYKQKLYAEVVGSIFILARHLDENFGFIHLADHPHSSGDVLPHINASPYYLQQIFFDAVFFHIKVEGQHLCDASNFPEAILCLMATFFIFNVDYPESCRCTLTVIEKVYLKSYETTVMDDKTQQWIKYLTMKEVKKYGK